jgi:hypothetical protein
VTTALDWRSVRALLESVGEVSEAPNGDLTATRPGRRVVLHPPRSLHVDDREALTSLRLFLDEDGAAPFATTGEDQRWVLLIDHREARVFRLQAESTQRETVHPHDAEDYFRHAHNSQYFARGQEKPDPNTYFEPVAAGLGSHGPIVLLGAGKGMASEKDQFANWLRVHHPAIAARIIASRVVDEHHVSEGELLAEARALFTYHPEPIV